MCFRCQPIILLPSKQWLWLLHGWELNFCKEDIKSELRWLIVGRADKKRRCCNKQRLLFLSDEYCYAVAANAGISRISSAVFAWLIIVIISWIVSVCLTCSASVMAIRTSLCSINKLCISSSYSLSFVCTVSLIVSCAPLESDWKSIPSVTNVLTILNAEFFFQPNIVLQLLVIIRSATRAANKVLAFLART